MTDDRWHMLVEQAKKSFENVVYYTEDLVAQSGEGDYKQGTQDILEFSNASGQFKIVRENRPVVLEKKMHFSHRQGDSARTEYVFSETEKSHKVVFYKADFSGEWRQISPADMGL